jgi:NADPH:quinone reductase-like Zn-dependent oxidoreductase
MKAITQDTYGDAGAVRPVVDRTYPLAEAPDAIRAIATGHARGKAVVTV